MAKQINGDVRFASRAEEEAQGIARAERLGLPYVDLNSFRVDADLFRSIPVDWMLKYGFVPESRTEKTMTIICADPADVVRLDELEMLIGVPLRLKVGSRAAIADILQKSESSQRVLDDATEDFRSWSGRTRRARRPSRSTASRRTRRPSSSWSTPSSSTRSSAGPPTFTSRPRSTSS